MKLKNQAFELAAKLGQAKIRESSRFDAAKKALCSLNMGTMLTFDALSHADADTQSAIIKCETALNKSKTFNLDWFTDQVRAGLRNSLKTLIERSLLITISEEDNRSQYASTLINISDMLSCDRVESAVSLLMLDSISIAYNKMYIYTIARSLITSGDVIFDEDDIDLYEIEPNVWYMGLTAKTTKDFISICEKINNDSLSLA